MRPRIRFRPGWAIAFTAAWGVALGAGSAGQTAAPAAGTDGGPHDFSMLGQYCHKCHNVEDWAGGIAFEALSPQNIPQDAETWEKAARKLRGGLMPPAGNPQPDRRAVEAFVSWIEGTVDQAALPHVEPGRVKALVGTALLGVPVRVEEHANASSPGCLERQVHEIG